MQGNYVRCYDLSRVSEGGYVNHPDDNGGPTNKGVTQGTYDAYRRSKRLPTRSVKLLTDTECNEIYKTQYWDTVGGDDLPTGLDYAVFDFALNSGPFKAAVSLQKLVGTLKDGVIGQNSITAVRKFVHERGIKYTIDMLCDNRLAYMRTLQDWRVFGKGWSSRVASVRAAALGMAGE